MSLSGIDISAWQSGINVAAIPADFVIIKATEGLGYVNSDCDRCYQDAINSGKRVGVYHFADGSGAESEADFFIDNVAGYVGHAILILDWESNALGCGPDYALAFLNRVQSRTGVKPVIYMSGSVTREYDWSRVVAGDYGLWVACYSVDSCSGYIPEAEGYDVGYWNDYCMLQYTSSGYLPGYGDRLDLNVFYGDGSAWDSYAGGSTGVSPATPVQNTGTVLNYGTSNIQYFCTICNYGAPDIDGEWGPETQGCVENAQRSYGIEVDGIWGPDTEAHASGQIRAYQEKLNAKGFGCAIDGIAGPETLQAVKNFQAAHGLEADGIIGELTYPVLMG